MHLKSDEASSHERRKRASSAHAHNSISTWLCPKHHYTIDERYTRTSLEGLEQLNVGYRNEFQPQLPGTQSSGKAPSNCTCAYTRGTNLSSHASPWRKYSQVARYPKIFSHKTSRAPAQSSQGGHLGVQQNGPNGTSVLILLFERH